MADAFRVRQADGHLRGSSRGRHQLGELRIRREDVSGDGLGRLLMGHQGIGGDGQDFIKDEHGDTKYLLVYTDEKNDEIVLNKKELIAEGNYGAVYKISDESEKINFAAKTYFNQDDSEITILKKL